MGRSGSIEFSSVNASHASCSVAVLSSFLLFCTLPELSGEVILATVYIYYVSASSTVNTPNESKRNKTLLCATDESFFNQLRSNRYINLFYADGNFISFDRHLSLLSSVVLYCLEENLLKPAKCTLILAHKLCHFCWLHTLLHSINWNLVLSMCSKDKIQIISCWSSNPSFY